MRRASLLASGKVLSAERIKRGDLFRRRWLMATLRRMILPEPVIFTRFAMAVCVFNFCFIVFLSIYLDSCIPGGVSNIHYHQDGPAILCV